MPHLQRRISFQTHPAADICVCVDQQGHSSPPAPPTEQLAPALLFRSIICYKARRPLVGTSVLKCKKGTRANTPHSSCYLAPTSFLIFLSIRANQPVCRWLTTSSSLLHEYGNCWARGPAGRPSAAYPTAASTAANVLLLHRQLLQLLLTLLRTC